MGKKTVTATIFCTCKQNVTIFVFRKRAVGIQSYGRVFKHTAARHVELPVGGLQPLQKRVQLAEGQLPAANVSDWE